jgi:hypothetical protein
MFARRRAQELSASAADRRAFVGIVMVSAGTSCRAADGVVACAPALSGGNRVSGGLRSRGRDPLPAGCVAGETHAVDLLPGGCCGEAVHDGEPEQRHRTKQDQSALGEGPPVG